MQRQVYARASLNRQQQAVCLRDGISKDRARLRYHRDQSCFPRTHWMRILQVGQRLLFSETTIDIACWKDSQEATTRLSSVRQPASSKTTGSFAIPAPEFFFLRFRSRDADSYCLQYCSRSFCEFAAITEYIPDAEETPEFAEPRSAAQDRH